jgi:hypothetical protein
VARINKSKAGSVNCARTGLVFEACGLWMFIRHRVSVISLVSALRRCPDMMYQGEHILVKLGQRYRYNPTSQARRLPVGWKEDGARISSCGTEKFVEKESLGRHWDAMSREHIGIPGLWADGLLVWCLAKARCASTAILHGAQLDLDNVMAPLGVQRAARVWGSGPIGRHDSVSTRLWPPGVASPNVGRMLRARSLLGKTIRFERNGVCGKLRRKFLHPEACRCGGTVDRGYVSGGKATCRWTWGLCIPDGLVRLD